MKSSDNQQTCYATTGQATNVLETIKLKREGMRNQMEMITKVNELMNTLTFLQTSIIEDDSLRTQVFIDHCQSELTTVKEMFNNNK